LFRHIASSEICTASLHDALPISRCFCPYLNGELFKMQLVQYSVRPSGAHLAETGGQSVPLKSADQIKSPWLLSVRSEEQLYSPRSEEHTSELQSRFDLVCRLLLE